MIHTLTPYPAYKDSGVPWLGEVPAHWEILRGKRVFKVIDIRSESGDEELLTVSSKDGVVPRSEKTVTMFKAESYVGHKLCWPGDLVINSLWAWMQGLGFSKYHGLVSSAYSVYRPKPEFTEYTDYFHYLLRSAAYKGELQTRSKGVWLSRLQLSDQAFLEMPIIAPTPEEQSAIVRYLDYMDRRIRRYIHAKQKLIKLLEEQKQAIIHRAVTRGLDPDVRLKDSGVEWLGDVPEHWEVSALRHRYLQCLGKMLDSKRITGNHSLPYLRNIDVQWDWINTENLPIMDISPSEYERYTVQRDDLLVCEGGEIGRCALWSAELGVCGFQKALHRLRPLDINRDIPRFMYYALRAAAKANVFNDGHVSTIAHLTGDKLRAHRFPFPPIKEQISLVTFLDSALGQINQTISVTNQEIAFLREYRTRLISDVVTGKLDVRNNEKYLYVNDSHFENNNEDIIEEYGNDESELAEITDEPEEENEYN